MPRRLARLVSARRAQVGRRKRRAPSRRGVLAVAVRSRVRPANAGHDGGSAWQSWTLVRLIAWVQASKPELVFEPDRQTGVGVLEGGLKYGRADASTSELANRDRSLGHSVDVQ